MRTDQGGSKRVSQDSSDQQNVVIRTPDGDSVVDETNDAIKVVPNGTTITNGQVTIDTTVGGVTIVSASAGRQGVVVTNQGSVACYIGTGTVSTANGLLLNAGESVALPTDSDVKAITASSSTTVGYIAFA